MNNNKTTEVKGFIVGTAPAVVALVSLAVKTGQRVRIGYGDTTTGRSWEIEDGTTGVIVEGQDGLYLKQRVTSKTGQKIPTDLIIRLTIGTMEVYRHPAFSQPDYEVREDQRYFAAPWWVFADDHVVKRFPTQVEAERWVAFMAGDRMNLSGRKDGI